jgi:hypothetical protein
MARAIPRLEALRHPERAAAWLRSTAVQALRAPRTREPEEARRETLRGLGVTDLAFDGLALMGVRERAAFVADTVEGLDAIDVETILREDAAAARRLVERARRHYLVTAAASLARRPVHEEASPDAPPNGLTRRVEALAEAALGGAWSAR